MLTASWGTRHAASLATRTTCSALTSTASRSSSGSSSSSSSQASPSSLRNSSNSSPSPSSWSHRTFSSSSASAISSHSSSDVSLTGTFNTASTSTTSTTTPPMTLAERIALARRQRSSPSASGPQEQLIRTSSNNAESINHLVSKSIERSAQASEIVHSNATEDPSANASANKSASSHPSPASSSASNVPNGTISFFARQFTPTRSAPPRRLRTKQQRQRGSGPPTRNEMLEAATAKPQQPFSRRAAPSGSTSTSSPLSASKPRRTSSSRLPSPEMAVSKIAWQLKRLEGRLATAERTVASLETPWEALGTEARSTFQNLYKDRIRRELSGPSKEVTPEKKQETTTPADTSMGDIDHLVHILRLTEIPLDDSPFYADFHERRRRHNAHSAETLKSRQSQLKEKLALLQEPPPRLRRDPLPSRRSTAAAGTNSTRPEPDLPPLPPRSDYTNFLTASSTAVTVLPQSPAPIASLTHGLQRVLFNPGVHFLQDPRSRVWNFPRGLLNDVPPIEDFDQTKLPRYVTSSEDKDLMALAEKEGKKLVGSTSSTVAMLCQIYFWMSKGKEVNLDMLSSIWEKQNKDFSMGQQLPASVELLYENGRYAIDADKSIDVTSGMNVLADYGHMMEKLLTTDQPEFRRFLKSSRNPAPSEADQRQAYHYMATDHMVLRSQLDAHDPHLPNVSFDLKTRGTIAIRQDRLNYIEGAGYTVDRLRGLWNSFEREYYDLVRSAFLKYQFQARIGHMDGCFVAYHSTRTFYGFQYVPIEEMDVALFGNHETGNQIFRLALGFLERILLEATSLYPERSIRMTFAASPKEDVLRVYVSGHSPAGSTTDDVAGPLTLLEYRGTNYVNGQPVRHVMIGPRQDTASRPTPKPAADADPVRATPPHLLPAEWEVGYSVTRSSTADPDESPLPPQEVRSMLASVRATQRMFSTLYLPSGISLHDLEDARKRVAVAYEKGQEPSEDDLKLIKMLPEREGMKYGRPSKLVSQLRLRAKSNAKTNELQESDDENSGHYEMRLTLVSRKDRVDEQ